MRYRNLLFKIKGALLLCLFVGSVASAKPKISAQSKLATDFSKVALPDSSSLFTLFADDKVQVRVFNNPTGFLLQLEAADEQTQQKFMINGLTVYVDPTGKSKDKYAVTFPSLASARMQNNQKFDTEPMAPAPSSDQSGDQRERRRHFDPMRIIQQINMKGASFDVDGDVRAMSNEWARLSLTPDKKICYIVQLPYSVLETKKNIPSLLSVGVLSEFTLPQGFGGGNGGGMGFRGGMGGPGGGPGGMGGPGGGMGGPGGGMGGPDGGGMPGAGRSRPSFAEAGKPVKGWIQIVLDAVQ